MGLAPWDEARYFQPPKIQLIAYATTAAMVLPADSTRVLIYFNNQDHAATLGISTTQSQATNANLLIPPNGALIMNYDWWGPLVTSQWWAAGIGSNGEMSITTVSLQSYPVSRGGLNAQIKALTAAIQRLSNYFQSTAVK